VPKPIALAANVTALDSPRRFYSVSSLRAVRAFHEQFGVTREDWEMHLNLPIKNKRHEYIPAIMFW
jgi:hypothetical protein